MHHFIYPSKDAYITNVSNSADLNFGLDEILYVGSTNVETSVVNPITTFSYTTQSVIGWCVTLFDGHISSGSLIGTSSLLAGTGSITGSASGSTNVSGSSGSFVSFSGSAVNFFGDVTDFTGRIISGTIYGTQTLLQSRRTVATSVFAKRALVQFDISTISSSIVSGDIPTPSFVLKMKTSREEETPLGYTLYACPLMESWNMGIGYTWDGGSEDGVSWDYRDYSGGTPWSSPGGTFTVPVCSQSFYYEVGDIEMDVSTIVNSWLSGSLTNNGFVILSADELLQSTSSGMTLYYFSNDSNTIYRPVLDIGWVDSTFITQSTSTSSIAFSTHTAGLYGVVTGDSQITGSSVSGSFVGTGNIIVVSNTASGIISVIAALSSMTSSVSIYGGIIASVTQSVVTVYTSCACPPGCVTSSSATQSVLIGFLTSGNFSGSSFSAVWDGYNLTNGSITGSWYSGNLSGSIITSDGFVSWPDIIPARLSGPYFSGQMLGSISATDSSSYGIFQGTLLTDYTNIVASVYLPFSGSIYMTDTAYTSSVILSSSSLEPVNFNTPFVVIVQNLKPTYRAGNIVRVNVFGREEFPIKNFGRSTQFSQFLTPKYLPPTSYYAIKDNETEEILVDFDNYTQLSCDMNGNYFLIDTTGLPQERYFKLLIKTEQSGSIYTIDNGDIFKIVR